MDHDGHRKRLRERFAGEGLEHFQYHEVLELLLTYAIPRRDTNTLAHQLIRRFGSFHAVLEADARQLMEVDGIGENAATMLTMLLPLYRKYECSRCTEKVYLRNQKQLNNYCLSLFHGLTSERFYVLSLNPQLELLAADLLGEGTPNQVPVYPRTVLDALLRHKAAGAVLAHNHPGGSMLPSQQDVDVTETISNILAPLDIKLYDHILVTDGHVLSFKEQGYLVYDRAAPRTP